MSGVERIRERPKRGKVTVAVYPATLSSFTPAEIVASLAPTLVEAAAKVGGRPTGEPELLTSAELLRVAPEHPEATAHPDAVWIVVDMVPLEAPPTRLATASDVAPYVAPPVRPKRRLGKRGR